MHAQGRRLYTLESAWGDAPIDMDIVDISYTTSSIALLRHTHFVLNREVRCVGAGQGRQGGLAQGVRCGDVT